MVLYPNESNKRTNLLLELSRPGNNSFKHNGGRGTPKQKLTNQQFECKSITQKY